MQGSDIHDVYASIYEHEVDELFADPTKYPVTLMYMPMQHMASAMLYCRSIFGDISLSDAVFGNMYSNQDSEIRDRILDQLKAADPQIRLVFTTSTLGMGFDSPSIERVIHTRPPRKIGQYLQEIGRAGRCGQRANAVLYYNNADIGSSDTEEAMVSYCKAVSSCRCLRETMLDTFGFKKSTNITACMCCIVCAIDCMCPVCNPASDM